MRKKKTVNNVRCVREGTNLHVIIPAKLMDGIESVSAGESGELLTYRMAAKILGLSESMIKKLVREGDLPSRKIGRSTRIRRVDIDAFLEEEVPRIRRKPPVSWTATTGPGRG